MYCHILRVRAIPTLESTDSMIPPNCYSHYMAWGCMCQLHAILDPGSRNSEAVQS